MKLRLIIQIFGVAAGLSAFAQSSSSEPQPKQSDYIDIICEDHFYYDRIGESDELRVVNPYHYIRPFPDTWPCYPGMSIKSEITQDDVVYKVTTLGSNVMNSIFGLREDMALPSSIRTLEPDAVKGLDFNLELNEGLTVIMHDNFKNLRTTGPLKIPSSVRYIGSNCFLNSPASSIEFNDGVTVIGSSSIYNMTNLEELRLPETLQKIGSGSISNLPSLKYLYIPRSLRDFSGIIKNCPALQTVELCYTSVDDLSVTPIDGNDRKGNFDKYILENCTFVVPAGCRELYEKHIIPGAKKIIEKPESASGGEKGMSNILVSDNNMYYNVICGTDEVRVVNPYGFLDSFVWIYDKSMKINEEVEHEGKTYKVTTVGSYFSDSLHGYNISLELPNSVRTLEPDATDNLSIDLSLNEGLFEIMDNNYSGSDLSTDVKFPSSLRYIGNNCFVNSEFKTLTFNEGLNFIGMNSFRYLDNIEEIILPESLRIIERGSFCDLYNLKRLYIPKGLVDFAFNFQECRSLERVEFSYTSVTEVGHLPLVEVFDRNVFKYCTFVVPDGTREIYDKWIIPDARHIVEKSEENSAADMVIDSSSASVDDDNALYTVSGLRISEEAAASHKGILIRRNNGKYEKVIVR